MKTAYLLLVIDTGKSKPEIAGASVFSEEKPTCIGRKAYALLKSAEAETFEEAAFELESMVKTGLSYNWLKDLFYMPF